MNAPIFYFGEHVVFTLNRVEGAKEYALPEDGWFHIAKYGALRKPIEREGKKPVEIIQDLDRDAARMIVVHFRDEAKKPNFGGLLVDFDHFSFDKTKSSRAAAWIDDIEDRADGIWAKMRLTSSGERALKSGDFRGFSPVLGFPARDFREGERVKPVALLAGALTNQPTFKGMAPMSNRSGDPQPLPRSGRADLNYKAKLLALLQLPASATDEEISAAIVTAEELAIKVSNYDAIKNRLNAQEEVCAARILNRAYEIMAREQVGFTVAFYRAERAEPGSPTDP